MKNEFNIKPGGGMLKLCVLQLNVKQRDNLLQNQLIWMIITLFYEMKKTKNVILCKIVIPESF